MTKAKYKILVCPSDRTGVSKFRSVDPHIRLQEMFPEDFWIDIDYAPKCEDENFFKQYDLVQFHRSIGPDFAKSQKAIEICKKLGIPTVCDIDDYWMPTVDHRS